LGFLRHDISKFSYYLKIHNFLPYSINPAKLPPYNQPPLGLRTAIIAGRAMANPLFPTDTIKDVAESLGILSLSPDAAKQLAMDVEYRIQEVVQEALKFMRHSKRTVLSPADISNALRTLNIEVLPASFDKLME
jgi:histone H3/H4